MPDEAAYSCTPPTHTGAPPPLGDLPILTQARPSACRSFCGGFHLLFAPVAQASGLPSLPSLAVSWLTGVIHLGLQTEAKRWMRGLGDEGGPVSCTNGVWPG